jgi:serine/threonine-protein kinase
MILTLGSIADLADRSHAQRGARLPPGARLNGIYEIDQHLSAGGMGEIYKGHEIQSGDPVAIKVLRSDLADDETALSLFRREAKALRSIHHEAIVRYYVFSDDPGIGRHYLAMEFVHGERLSDIIQRHPVAFDQVLQLQQRIAAALHEAHRNGIIHRDVSPDNVLVPDGDPGRAKIIDFGIARSTRSDDTTIIGSGFAGKYNYVSPEQLGLFGGNVTAKSDIYSLGLLLAQCLAGQPINMGGTHSEILEKRRAVPDLGAIDRRFHPLLEQMLQPNPADRPESMAAVAAWRPNPKIRPPPRRAPATPHRTEDLLPTAVDATKSNSMLGRRLAMGALGLVLLLGIGSVGFYFSISPPRPTDLRTRIIEFVNAYDSPDAMRRRGAPPHCFFVEPVTVKDGDVRLEGLGISQEPFNALYSEFMRKFGGDPTIAWGQVTPEQCPAVNFLSRTKNESGVAPQLDIDASGLRNMDLLTGTVAEFGDRHVELLLITDDGYVRNLTEKLTPSGNTKTFSLGLKNPGAGPGQLPSGSLPVQLLFGVASSNPLEALKLSPGWSRAEQVFAQVQAEVLRSNQTVKVGWKRFLLEP